MSLTWLRSLGRRRLPLNLRVTHGPAILANGIPGGSPTRAPRSLGPSEPPFPPFGEAVPGSIGRPLCPSDRGAAPSLERGGRLGPPWAARPPGAGLRPCRVLVAGRGRGASGGEVGVSGRRVPGDGWERYGCVCVCVFVILPLERTWGEEYSVQRRREWIGTAVYTTPSTLSFPVQWADAAGTRDSYTVSTIFL